MRTVDQKMKNPKNIHVRIKYIVLFNTGTKQLLRQQILRGGLRKVNSNVGDNYCRGTYVLDFWAAVTGSSLPDDVATLELDGNDLKIYFLYLLINIS